MFSCAIFINKRGHLNAGDDYFYQQFNFVLNYSDTWLALRLVYFIKLSKNWYYFHWFVHLDKYTLGFILFFFMYISGGQKDISYTKNRKTRF